MVAGVDGHSECRSLVSVCFLVVRIPFGHPSLFRGAPIQVTKGLNLVAVSSNHAAPFRTISESAFTTPKAAVSPTRRRDSSSRLFGAPGTLDEALRGDGGQFFLSSIPSKNLY